MSSITVKLLDATRKPLNDIADLDVVDASSGRTVAAQRQVDARKSIKITNLLPATVYRVNAFPLRHRPVGSLTTAADATLELCAPVLPHRVSEVDFPSFARLPRKLREVLDRSVLERDEAVDESAPGGPSAGEVLYDGLENEPRAGLLNLFTKLSATPLGAVNAWSFVRDVFRLRGDRVFANVSAGFRDAIKNAQAAGHFEEVSGRLHKPALGYSPAGSFKTTADRYGVLQVSFFSSDSLPLQFKTDIDIDDAGGLGHVFQVLRNHLTGMPTHPYDIHQILCYAQRLRPPYALRT
jgi:hypothetical protein